VGSRRRGLIELLRAHQTARCQIMVARDARVLMLTEQFNALIRVRPVTDEIAQAPDSVDWPRRLGMPEHCLEGRQVGVNVGDDCDAHFTSTQRRF
jgi:hypothetical protein